MICSPTSFPYLAITSPANFLPTVLPGAPNGVRSKAVPSTPTPKAAGKDPLPKPACWNCISCSAIEVAKGLIVSVPKITFSGFVFGVYVTSLPKACAPVRAAVAAARGID